MTLEIILLVVSNLSMIPSLILTCKRKLYAESTILFCTMLSSMFYHGCSDMICYGIPTEILRLGDFLYAELSVLTIITYLALFPPEIRLTVLIIWYSVCVMIILGVREFEPEFYLFGIGCAIYIFRMIYLLMIERARGLNWIEALGKYCGQNPSRVETLPLNVSSEESIISLHYNLPYWICGMALSVSGLIAKQFETLETYYWVHSLWHTLIMFSSFFFILAVRE